MPDVAIKLSKENLVEGLSNLPVKEIKYIVDSLIQKKLFKPPSAKKIYREATVITQKRKLSSQVAEEAVAWARLKK
ncbi:MAG: hypothetical protein FJ242_10030 [Nitrospira sp.]|nr:hypothetical protein [Nitrospira sp.]